MIAALVISVSDRIENQHQNNVDHSRGGKSIPRYKYWNCSLYYRAQELQTDSYNIFLAPGTNVLIIDVFFDLVAMTTWVCFCQMLQRMEFQLILVLFWFGITTGHQYTEFHHVEGELKQPILEILFQSVLINRHGVCHSSIANLVLDNFNVIEILSEMAWYITVSWNLP